MNFQPLRKKADHLRTIPLTAVLRAWGAQPDPHDRHKWHTPQGVLSVTGAQFMNWSRGGGGGGAIDLVIHLNRSGFGQALDWLAAHFPSPPSQTDLCLAPPQFKLPPPDPTQLARVRHYLLQQRRLLPGLIDPLIQTGSLYADARANAVFVLRGQQDTPLGPELRGTTVRSWRGMAPGSKKDLGFFSIPSVSFPFPKAHAGQGALVLCASAIDAISCRILHPHLGCVSTAGARPNPRWLGPLLQQGHRLYCGFDTDTTGQAMAQAMMALYPAVQRMAPSDHDWNDTLPSRSERAPASLRSTPWKA
jgi:hypothetical protein